MLFSTVIGFVGYFKTRDQGKAYIDDLPFRLHYTFTTAFLFLGSVLVGLQDLVGKNIDCINASDAINYYCWITGTQILVNSNPEDRIYTGVGTGVHYGTRHCIETYDAFGRKTWETSRGEPCFRTIDYYIWIPYVLFLKGCLFYIPRLLWLSWEEGVMNTFSEGVRYGTKVEKEKVDDVADIVTRYLKNDEYMGHIRYGWGYVLAQTLNFLNVIGAFLFTDYFFHGQFKNLGTSWLYNNSNSILQNLFPRITTCIFEQYGSGGVVERNDYLCILAPNVISEKIYLFLWFWLILLGLISGVNLILVLFMTLKNSRIRTLYMMRAVLNSKKIAKSDNKNTEKALASSIQEMSLGQFLFLYLLGRNVDRRTYESILLFYSKSLGRGDQYISLETLEQNSRLSSVLQG